MPRSKAPPKYRFHKPSGQAVVTIDNRDHYLGRHNSAESREKYNRLLSEWFAQGQRLPSTVQNAITIGQLALEFIRHADTYYRRPDGTPTNEPSSIRAALKPLNRLYSRIPAAEFSPVKLRAVRAEMVRLGWVRTNINRQISRIRQLFKFGVSHDRVPGGVYHALQSLEALSMGRSDAVESDPVKPVPPPMIEAVVKIVSPQIAAMIKLQRLTGMRPAEVCSLQTGDVKTTGKAWTYIPTQHKNAYRGHSRAIFLGPQAQEILRTWLRTDLAACVFQPTEAEDSRHAALSAARQSRIQPSQSKRAAHSRRRRRRRAPSDHYTVDAYRRSIQRACDRAFDLPKELAAVDAEVKAWVHKFTYDNDRAPRLKDLPKDLKEARNAVEAFRAAHRWHPHQLRHNAATELRARFGLEAARLVLGHRSAAVTELYAEIDQTKAAEIMAQVG